MASISQDCCGEQQRMCCQPGDGEDSSKKMWNITQENHIHMNYTLLHPLVSYSSGANVVFLARTPQTSHYTHINTQTKLCPTLTVLVSIKPSSNISTLFPLFSLTDTVFFLLLSEKHFNSKKGKFTQNHSLCVSNQFRKRHSQNVLFMCKSFPTH